LLLAALRDKPEVRLLLIAKGADMRVRDQWNHYALSHYGHWARPRLDSSVKAQRVAELKAAYRAGCHPSQVQRRKIENWAKRWPLMNAAYGSGLLLTAAKEAPAHIPDKERGVGAVDFLEDTEELHEGRSDEGSSDEEEDI
jgi:hypothetical protein